jgi:hypothetical protein
MPLLLFCVPDGAAGNEAARVEHSSSSSLVRAGRPSRRPAGDGPHQLPRRPANESSSVMRWQ